jgi:uncharacterized membrane protein YidH (DUF202 family)
MRTGLALIGASLGLLKWDQSSQITGYLIAATGVVVLIMATHRYFHVMKLLEGGMFEPNIHGIVLIVTVVVTAIVTAFSVELHERRAAIEA